MIPAHRWPALRRLVRVIRIARQVVLCLSVIAHFAAFWLAAVGLAYVLGHPDPIEPATLIVGIAVPVWAIIEAVNIARVYG